jgi:hypothetical protein
VKGGGAWILLLALQRHEKRMSLPEIARFGMGAAT